MQKVYIYKRFERFWHWSQALLIFFLALTGFEVHDSIHLFGYEKAVSYHRIGAWMLIGLIVFAIFWHITTGEWKQYIPSFPNCLLRLDITHSECLKENLIPRTKPSVTNSTRYKQSPTLVLN